MKASQSALKVFIFLPSFLILLCLLSAWLHPSSDTPPVLLPHSPPTTPHYPTHTHTSKHTPSAQHSNGKKPPNAA